MRLIQGILDDLLALLLIALCLLTLAFVRERLYQDSVHYLHLPSVQDERQGR